jgi:hypothetical protein
MFTYSAIARGAATVACASFVAALLISAPLRSVAASDLMLAQIDKQPPQLPEVNPRIDNPDNPAVPGSDKDDAKPIRPEDASPRTTTPGGPTAEGRSRCGALTDTLARRRCLEELQQDIHRNR